MRSDLCAQLAALPPVEVAGLVVDIGPLFRAMETLILPRADCADRPDTGRGVSLHLVMACAFGSALSQHRAALGLSRDQVFAVSCAFAGLCDVVLGVPDGLIEQQIRGVP